MFHLDSRIMDVIFDEDGSLISYLIKMDDITIEIPVFNIEAEKRTASVLWIWLSKLYVTIKETFKKYSFKDNSNKNINITIFTLSEFISNLGHLFPYNGLTISDLKRQIEESNLFPLFFPNGTFIIIRDDLHLEFFTDENIWERIVCGVAIYAILFSSLEITESIASYESKEIVKLIPSKPKIPAHASALAFIGLLKEQH